MKRKRFTVEQIVRMLRGRQQCIRVIFDTLREAQVLIERWRKENRSSSGSTAR